MQAIKTKYLAPTSTRPGRVKATTGSAFQSLTVSVHSENDSLSREEVHAYAASKLAQRLGWYTKTNYLIGGGVGNDAVWVFSDSELIAPKWEENT